MPSHTASRPDVSMESTIVSDFGNLSAVSEYTDATALTRDVQKVDIDSRLVLKLGVVELTKQLTAEIKKQFIAGGHNRNNYTLSEVTVRIAGNAATIKMRGGGYFVEHGFPAHWIEGNPHLHWATPEEGFAARVYNPGYKGDPFVERAMDLIDYETILDKMAVKALSGIPGVGQEVSTATSDIGDIGFSGVGE